MNTKQTFAALAFALAMVAGNAQAITTEEMNEAMKDYVAEMPELSYQPDAIDCKIAKRLAMEGDIEAIDAFSDVREHTDLMAMMAEGGTIPLVMDFDFRGRVEKYLKNEKGFDEVMATYKGFYLQGAWAGAAQKQRVKNLTLKEKRDHAKAVGEFIEQKCEGYKENGELKKPIALFKVSAGKF
ncbi:hypothetical protein JR736_004593 [Escherichia coli]|nr:hypothetical protein [Escherichia coli]